MEGQIQTFFIYGFTLMSVVMLAQKAQKTNKKVFVWLIVLVLSCLAGLRAYSVGIDTESYISIFKNLELGIIDGTWGEIGFKFFSYAILKVFGEYSFLLFLYALITNLCIVFRLWDYKNIASFPWMIACYYVSFYFMTMNVMRQFVAIGLLFFATRYIAQRKYIRFIIWMCVASLFHTSMLIGVVFIAAEVLQWRYLSKMQKYFIAILCCVGLFTLGFLLDTAGSNYGHYFNTIDGAKMGAMIPVKLALFALSMPALKKIRNMENTYEINTNGASLIYHIRCIKLYYLVGLLLTATGYYFMYMDRIGLVFYIFECVYFGILAKNARNRKLFGLIIFALLTFLYITVLTSNGQGQLPYYFVWQKSIF